MNWGMIFKLGVIICKDGSFLVVWFMIGIDLEFMEERIYVV